ncbi:MAG: hypothetical protein ACI841_000292 [Planctomycetota bacterium]|jgi:hypothetical protein
MHARRVKEHRASKFELILGLKAEFAQVAASA